VDLFFLEHLRKSKILSIAYSVQFRKGTKITIIVLIFFLCIDPIRAPKTDENDLLIFIFVDPFSKSLVDYLFLLIFQQISTNIQIQQKQINK